MLLIILTTPSVLKYKGSIVQNYTKNIRYFGSLTPSLLILFCK